MFGAVGVQIVTTQLLAAGVLLLLAAALHDIATRTIPNSFVLCIAGTGFIRQILQGSIMPGLAAFVLVLAAAIFCWRRRYIGGGDAKLLAAASLMVPPGQVMSLILAVAVAGGCLSLLYLSLRWLCTRPRAAAIPRSRRPVARFLRMERYRLRRGITLPYATAIAAGTIFVLWRG
jgi:prepilin peptidase CpaA